VWLARVSLLFFVIPAELASSQTARTNVPLTSATVKEVKDVVNITGARDTERSPSQPGEKLSGEDLLETGNLPSIAELEIRPNHAVYRLASGTLFSFSTETGRLHMTKGLGLMSVEGGQVVCETCKYVCSAQSTAIWKYLMQMGSPATTKAAQ